MPVTASNEIQEAESYATKQGVDWKHSCLIITKGLPGSGKTTWAKAMVVKHSEPFEGQMVMRVNRDEIRLELGFRYDPRREKEVTAIQDARIKDALERAWIVIVDDTHLNAATLAHRWAQAADANVPLVVIDTFMKVPLEECVKRDNHRENGVGKDVIERMYYSGWSGMPKPENKGARNAIICDIDGTLAGTKMSYPAAYNRDYRTDFIVPGVANAVLQASKSNVDVLLVSGRDEENRFQTEEWLRMNDVPYDKLIMRKKGDRRDDAVAKKELYMENIQGNWFIHFVLDDRPRVVRMWRAELGLTVFHVAPNIEF